MHACMHSSFHPGNNRPASRACWQAGRAARLQARRESYCRACWQASRVRGGAGAAGQAVGEADAALVAAAVASEEALACDHPAVQAQTLAVVSNLVSLAGARARARPPGGVGARRSAPLRQVQLFWQESFPLSQAGSALLQHAAWIELGDGLRRSRRLSRQGGRRTRRLVGAGGRLRGGCLS